MALYPGSFDPVHAGHLAVIEVAAGLFGDVVIAVGHNPAKPSGYLSVEERVALIVASTTHLANVRTETFSGLVTTAATRFGADCLLKGVRNATDLDTELLQANMNAESGGGLPTVLIPGIGPGALVSSRYVREIAGHGGDVSSVVPDAVAAALTARSDKGERREDQT